LRLLTLNIWQEQGAWERRLELLCERLATLRVDVVCLQEVRDKPGAVPNQAETIARSLGVDWVWMFAAGQTWDGGDEGVALLSRYPLEQREVQLLPSRETNRRVCLAARVRPESAPASGAGVWVATTHLAYRVADGELRERQVLALDAFVGGLREPGDSAIIAGDFNAIPEADELRFLRGLTTLHGRRSYWQDAYACCHPGAAGPTWCTSNPYTEQLSWFPGDRRLDYVFLSPQTREGRSRVVSAEIVLDEPAADGTYVSDHFGVLVDVDV